MITSETVTRLRWVFCFSGVQQEADKRCSLGFWTWGHAFHLVTRVYALWNGRTSVYPVSLGIDKLLTSITVTVFYVLLYHVWQQGAKSSRPLLIYALAVARIALCLFPQNQWLVSEQLLSWSIYRNLPFSPLSSS